MSIVIENKSYDAERALYDSHDIVLLNCSFTGEADGESALKESGNIKATNCYFNLRYPLWHDNVVSLTDCEMTENCRAALWYSSDIVIKNTKLHGIKALRECKDVTIDGCDIISPEFGWSVSNIKMTNSSASSEYFFMRSENINFNNVRFKGKYSFQYIKNAVFENCEFDTKDAFWHGENIVVRNSVIKGEYFAWYSNGLTLENCKIIGTQPFCYCQNLKLVNCEMTDCDLSFERSTVDADITTPVVSIKNPLSGRISVPAVGEIILDGDQYKAKIIIKG